MKPRIKYIIGIQRTKRAEYYWSIRSVNSNKVGTVGESYKRKIQAVNMAKSLFLHGFYRSLTEHPDGALYCLNGEYRLLVDYTKKKPS